MEDNDYGPFLGIEIKKGIMPLGMGMNYAVMAPLLTMGMDSVCWQPVSDADGKCIPRNRI